MLACYFSMTLLERFNTLYTYFKIWLIVLLVKCIYEDYFKNVVIFTLLFLVKSHTICKT